MRNHFLLCWVTKLAVSVLHVSRLCQIPGGGSVGDLHICCYKGNCNNGTRERTHSSSAIIDAYINSSLAEELQNYSFTLIQNVGSDY